jgi:hypothetical protein
MSVTQRYIDLLLPSLIESNYGTLSTTKTEEGFNAYSFSCPFCSKFVHSKKCKKTETSGVREGTRPNVEVDISRSTTSSVCTIIPSGGIIVMTST